MVLCSKQVEMGGTEKVFWGFLCQSTGVSGVRFRSYRCQIKSFIFTSFSMGMHSGERGVRKHRKNPLKWWDEFSFKGMVQAGTNKTDSGHSC